MSKTELPYKAGTKGFLIAQRLLAGEDYRKIEGDMRVSRKSIWNVASQLRRQGFRIHASRNPPLENSDTPPLHQTNSQGESTREVHGGKSSENNGSREALGSSPVKPQGSSREPEEGFYRAFGRELEMVATPILRKVVLNPKIPLYYDITREELKAELPQNYDFGDFICDCVQFFMKYGLKGELQWVKKREVA